MKFTFTREIEFVPTTLLFSARVRYWEDATVNGVIDYDGVLIPFRSGDKWTIRVNLSTGRVFKGIGYTNTDRWPKGTTASVHYMVCDGGEYWLTNGEVMAKWKGDCVPDKLLCMGKSGYGDYIIMKINGDGFIEGWTNPVPNINPEEWELEMESLKTTRRKESRRSPTRRRGAQRIPGAIRKQP